jgi:hypothetical protein
VDAKLDWSRKIFITSSFAICQINRDFITDAAEWGNYGEWGDFFAAGKILFIPDFT